MKSDVIIRIRFLISKFVSIPNVIHCPKYPADRFDRACKKTFIPVLVPSASSVYVQTLMDNQVCLSDPQFQIFKISE